MENKAITMRQLDQTRERFADVYGDTANMVTVLSPASVIFLGDHTHYNDGILISATVNRYVAVAARTRDDDSIYIRRDDDSEFKYPANEKTHDTISNAIAAMLNLLKEEKKLITGFECVYSCTIPEGIRRCKVVTVLTGLLSAINRIFHLGMKDNEIAEITWKAEEQTMGKVANLSYHYTTVFGKAERFLFSDLRSKTHKNYHCGKESLSLLLFDTMKPIPDPHEICITRMSECEVGVKGLRLYIWGVKNLRDVELDFLEKHVNMIPQRVYSRCHYTVSEKVRVDNTVKAIRHGEIGILGDMMNTSHFSLRNEYELGEPELDYIVQEGSTQPGVYGSKLVSCSPTNAVIMLVNAADAENILAKVNQSYKVKFGGELKSEILEFVDGVKKVNANEYEHV